MHPGVGPDDIGRRVSVRRRLGVENGRPVYGDVVGRLLAVEDGELFVLRHTGELAEVRVADLVAGKTVPPLPAKFARPGQRWAAEVDELERVAAACWPAAEQAALGDWLLRAHGGVTKRANSAAVIGDPGCGLDDALARVREWYAARGLPPLLQVAAGTDIDLAVRGRGWRGHSPTLLQTAGLDGVRAALAGDRPAPVTSPGDGSPTDAWLALAGPDPGARRALVSAGPAVGLAAWPDAASPVAIGRVSVIGDWAGVTSVAVHPQHRRQGLARQVMAGLLDWAAARGAGQVLLQVEADNAAARALYAGLGLRTHHLYRYCSPG